MSLTEDQRMRRDRNQGFCFVGNFETLTNQVEMSRRQRDRGRSQDRWVLAVNIGVFSNSGDLKS